MPTPFSSPQLIAPVMGRIVHAHDMPLPWAKVMSNHPCHLMAEVKGHTLTWS